MATLGIMIEQDVTIRAGKRQCLPELLHDPLARGMCRAVEMEKASSTMFDDKEAVERSKCECWNGKEVEGDYHFAMVIQERQPALGFAVVLSALDPREKPETVGSEISKPSWSDSPWIRGAPKPGFSAFNRRMRRRISTLTLGRPACRDFQRQNRRKVARCQDNTVSGLTRMRTLAQPEYQRRSATQNSRSK